MWSRYSICFNIRNLYHAPYYLYFFSLSRFYQFHVVDERISVLPSVRAVTGERFRVNVLGMVQVVEGLSKQMDSVIDQGCLRLEKKGGENIGTIIMIIIYNDNT